MSTDKRVRDIEFIENDTKSRGEEIVSNISFLGALYHMDVKVNGKIKTVKYSGAESVLKGYREIHLK